MDFLQGETTKIETGQRELDSLRALVKQLHIEHEDVTLSTIRRAQSLEQVDKRTQRMLARREAHELQYRQLEQLLARIDREIDETDTSMKSLRNEHEKALHELRRAAERKRLAKERLRLAWNENVTLQKSQEKTIQLNDAIQQERDMMEYQIATLEEEIARLNVEFVHLRDKVADNDERNAALTGQIDQMARWLGTEGESLRRRNVYIDRQQSVSNMLQTKLNQLISAAGVSVLPLQHKNSFLSMAGHCVCVAGPFFAQ